MEVTNAKIVDGVGDGKHAPQEAVAEALLDQEVTCEVLRKNRGKRTRASCTRCRIEDRRSDMPCKSLA